MSNHEHDFEIPDATPERDAPAGSAWHSAHRVLLLVGAAALLLWILSGVYYVGASEEAVVDRCGEYVTDSAGKVARVGPGIYMGMPWPLDRIEKIPTKQSSKLVVNTFDSSSPELGALKMEMVGKQQLTADEFDAKFNPALITADRNIIYAGVTVNFKIQDPSAYVRAVAETPGEDLTARQKLFTRLIERDLTVIANHSNAGHLLTSRSDLEKALLKRIRQSFELAQTGLAIESITLSPPHVTEKNKAAYDSVNTALRERDITIADARAYEGRRINEADAEAKKIVNSAETYRSRVLDAANGEAERFFNFYQQAYKNPETAWFDKWTETVREVLKSASRVYFVRPGQKVYIRSPLPDKVLETPGP